MAECKHPPSEVEHYDCGELQGLICRACGAAELLTRD